jgi:hypothetical protein
LPLFQRLLRKEESMKVKNVLSTISAICSRFGLSILLCSSLLSVNAFAHVHGEGELTFAMEEQLLLIEFSAPKGDLVGFEYAPTNDAEQIAVREAKTTLEDKQTLFVISGGECQLQQALVDMANYTDNSLGSNSLGDSHSHADSGHSHKHDDHAHSDHDDKHKAQHRDVQASYQFSCASTEAITKITFNIFEAFPAISTVNAQWISEQGQGSLRLNAESKDIGFK